MKKSGAEILFNAAKRTLEGGVGSTISSTDIASQITSGAEVARDKSYFVKAAASQVSEKELLNSATAKSRNTCNFVNGQLESGRVLVVTDLRLASAVNASPTAAAYSNVLPAAVQNGEYKIVQGQKTLLEGPISDFHAGAAGVNPGDGFRKMENPFIIQPGEAITVQLYFGASTAENTNIEMVFRGVENSAR